MTTTASNGAFFPQQYGSGLMAKDIAAILKMLTVFTQLLKNYCSMTSDQYSQQMKSATLSATAEQNYWGDEAWSAFGQAAGSLLQAGVSFVVAVNAYKATLAPQEEINEAQNTQNRLQPLNKALQERAALGQRPTVTIGPAPEGGECQPLDEGGLRAQIETDRSPAIKLRINEIKAGLKVDYDETTESACKLMDDNELAEARSTVGSQLKTASEKALKGAMDSQRAQQLYMLRETIANKSIDSVVQMNTGISNIYKGKEKYISTTMAAKQSLAGAAANTAAQQANKEYQSVEAAINAFKAIVQAQTSRV